MEYDRDRDDPGSTDPTAEAALADDRDDQDEEFVGEYEEEAFDQPDAAGEDAAVERLRELVLYLASNLTDDPEAVEVSAERRGQNLHLELRVPEEELGKVIGRQGRIARAMRTALTIAGSRHNVRATLDIDD